MEGCGAGNVALQEEEADGDGGNKLLCCFSVCVNVCVPTVGCHCCSLLHTYITLLEQES